MRLYPESESQEALIMSQLSTSGALGEIDGRTLVLKHLAPGLGCVVAFIMCASRWQMAFHDAWPTWHGILCMHAASRTACTPSRMRNKVAESEAHMLSLWTCCACGPSCLRFFSPFKAVMAVRKSGTLGAFNPLPLVAIIANCLGWLVYGKYLCSGDTNFCLAVRAPMVCVHLGTMHALVGTSVAS